MAPESGSITTGDEIRSTLAEEQSTEYSDVKVPPSPMCNEGFSREKNYWFGKKYFECVLAQYILKSSHTYQSSTDIDRILDAKLRNYPFEENIKLLQDKISSFADPKMLREFTDHRHAFLTMVGSLAFRGARGDRLVLHASLRRFGRETNIDNSQAARELQWQPHEDVKGPKSSTSKAPIVTKSSECVMALNQYGDKHDASPIFSHETISLHPPSFQATVSFRGRLFKGRAKTKEQAWHEAARKACKSFGIM